MALACTAHMEDLVDPVGFTVITCTQDMEGYMEIPECIQEACITVGLGGPWVAMGWAWVVLMVTQIQIIHMALLLPHQAFGCPSSEW